MSEMSDIIVKTPHYLYMMNLQEVLKIVEDLVFAETGKPLDYLQKAILQGTIAGDTYAKIAEETYNSEGHVRDVGSELWQLLSEKLGKDVSKKNFKTLLKKGNFYHVSSAIGKSFVGINNVSICPGDRNLRDIQPPVTSKRNKAYLDLGSAPEVLSFYGRQQELATLEDSIVKKRCRLMTILGIGGIGKTTLAVRLISQIQTQFDCVIYRSLQFCPSLDELLNNLIEVVEAIDTEEVEIARKLKDEGRDRGFSRGIAPTKLLSYLNKYRCLIIFDDVQMLFSREKIAGEYQSGYEDYGAFFKWLAKSNHLSCLILISGENIREFSSPNDKSFVSSLVLGSLGDAAKEICREASLLDAEFWENLIGIYQGNPLWLEMTISTINGFFGGSVADFLQYKPPFLCESLLRNLGKLFQGLTDEEKLVLFQLAQVNNPVSLGELDRATKTQLSPSMLCNALESLSMRFLVETTERGRTKLFILNSLIKKYYQISQDNYN